MTLQSLRYAIAVAESGSFSKAAKDLYVSQSTLSASIKELENDLGINLFLRTSRGIQLTEDGEDFLRYARDIVSQSISLEKRYQRRKYVPTRFAVSTQRLPFVVKAFERFMKLTNWSSYDIALRECPTYSIINDVSAGKSDLGVLAVHDHYLSALTQTFNKSLLSFTEIDRLQTYAFLSKNHPLASRDEVSMEELIKYPFVTYDQEADRSEFTEEIIFHQIADRTIHVSDRATKIAIVRFTDAFSVGPDLTNSNADNFHSGMGEVIAKPIIEMRESLHTGYLARSSAPLSEASILFLELLRDRVRALKS